MHKKVLASASHITIEHDPFNNILYANWTGNQTKKSIMDGCEQILYYLEQNQCSKVLNDNTSVTSLWLEASWWVAVDWFPRMHEANCKLFAWISSPNHDCRLSTEETLKFGILDVITLTFQSRDAAEEWLKGYETALNDNLKFVG